MEDDDDDKADDSDESWKTYPAFPSFVQTGPFDGMRCAVYVITAKLSLTLSGRGHEGNGRRGKPGTNETLQWQMFVFH